MIAILLAKWGLAWLAPFVIPGLIALALGTGGLVTWWLDLTDWSTLILLVVALGLVLQYSVTESRTGRIVLVALLCGVIYLKGTFDQQTRSEENHKAEIIELTKKHDDRLARVNAAYKKARDDERDRQERVIAKMASDAELAKLTWDREREEAREKLKQLQKEAASDPDADRIGLSVDAVERLNRLRYDPARRRARPKGGRRKAQPGRTSLLDDASLSSSHQDAQAEAPAEGDRGPLERRPEKV